MTEELIDFVRKVVLVTMFTWVKVDICVEVFVWVTSLTCRPNVVEERSATFSAIERIRRMPITETTKVKRVKLLQPSSLFCKPD